MNITYTFGSPGNPGATFSGLAPERPEAAVNGRIMRDSASQEPRGTNHEVVFSEFPHQ